MKLRKFYQCIADAADCIPADVDGRHEQLLLNLLAAMKRHRGLKACRDELPAQPIKLFDTPEFAAQLDQPDLLGRAYQALNAPALERAFRERARNRKKFNERDLPAVTQLFTPSWVVEFLLHNTLGRLWVQMHPDTCLKRSFRFYIDGVSDSGGSASLPELAREIRVLDPACGTMNFGLIAFKMLCEMYREELENEGSAGWPMRASADGDSIGAAVLANNIFGVDIDPLALRLAKASLEMAAGFETPHDAINLIHADALFDQSMAKQFDGTFDVVATNPPYVAADNLPPQRVAQLKKRFPASWRDLYAGFIERSIELLKPGGRAGLLAMHSFMFTGSYEKLRAHLSQRCVVDTVAHFGPGLFGVGNPGTLQTAALILKRQPPDGGEPSMIYRLTDVAGELKEGILESAIAGGRADLCFRPSQAELSNLPRKTWAYWINESGRRAFAHFPKLGDLAPLRQGLATTDNFRFVRYAWEVEPTHPSAPLCATRGKWFPYAKGGQFRRWRQLPSHRVNWEDDGREIKQSIVDRYPYLNGAWQWVAKNTSFYFRQGICWSYLTSGRFSARRLEAGSIFDVAGSSVFPADIPGVLALLNSAPVAQLLNAINPTVNFQVGDLAQLPIPRQIPSELAALAEKAMECQREFDSWDERTADFVAMPKWVEIEQQFTERTSRLINLEREINRIAADAYGMPTDSESHDTATEIDLREMARLSVYHAIKAVLDEQPGRIIRIAPADRGFILELRDVLESKTAASKEIESLLEGLERYVARDFYPWYARRYAYRPAIWAFAGGGETYMLAHDFAEAKALRWIARKIDARSPGESAGIDLGVAVRLAAAGMPLSDRVLGKKIAEIAADLDAGRMQWTELSR